MRNRFSRRCMDLINRCSAVDMQYRERPINAKDAVHLQKDGVRGREVRPRRKADNPITTSGLQR